ncbi:MAG: monofunctional biosynthetic peptidoglycan transglycosylase, partial [Elusimicrobia bacterium]|nr:monofunctional biosynthetic peptidoglycan transglycosylase [Elusimicrobiota bacterium]
MAARRRKGFSRVLRLLFLSGFAVCAASVVYLLWLPDVAPLRKSNPKTTCYIELRRAQAEKAGKKFQLRMAWLPWGLISEHL